MKKHRRFPEIIMEGSHVLHTDEDGNILLDQQGDQDLNTRERHRQEIDAAFDHLSKNARGRVSRNNPALKKFIAKMRSIGYEI